jgi:tRNA-specific 2-thiouridylase
VRNIAEQIGLATAKKKDSQGLCFIGKVRLPDFLQQQLHPKKGDIIQIPKVSSLFEDNNIKTDNELSRVPEYRRDLGEVVGEHNGAHFFTIGQRKGLQVGGTAEPLFVIHTDVTNNIIYVGMGDQHPGLYRRALLIKKKDIHWLRSDDAMSVGESRVYDVRIRYRQGLQKASLKRTPEGMYVVFEQAQRGVSPGQFAAWYKGEELLGSGVIS